MIKFPIHKPSSCSLSKMWTSGMRKTAACPHLLLLTVLPSTTSQLLSLLQSVTLLACLKAKLCCTTLLFKVMQYKIKNVFFVCVCLFLLLLCVYVCSFLMYYVCANYYKPITEQYCIADSVTWIPRLNLLDFQTNWLSDWNVFICRGL